MVTCHNCKGNGFNKVKFEAEESITQCKVCHSLGEIKEDEYFMQTWEDENGNPVLYQGPPLNPEDFKKYKIHPSLARSRI